MLQADEPEETGVSRDGRVRVEVDPRYFRPSEVDYLCGDASKARRALDWHPRIGFDDLVSMMVAADLAHVGHISMAGSAR